MLKSLLLLALAALLLAFSLWFFKQSGDLLAGRDYIAGCLHVFVGYSTIRAAVELARLSVVQQARP